MEIDEEYYNVQDVNNTSKRLSSPGICMKMEWKGGGGVSIMLLKMQ